MLPLLLLACAAAPAPVPAEPPGPPTLPGPVSPDPLPAPPAPPDPLPPGALQDVDAFLSRHAPRPLPALGFDPAKAKYLDTVVTGLGLTPGERARIERDGVVVTRPPTNAYTYAGLYRSIYGHDLPVLITVESVWFAYQDSYARALRTVQTDVVRPSLSRALGKLRAGLSSVPAASRADLDVLLTVAAVLDADPPGYGEPVVPIPAGEAANQAEVDRVLALVGGEVDVVDTLFGRERSLALSRLAAQRAEEDAPRQLWRTVAWLQTARFVLVEDGAPVDRETSDALALSALVSRTGADRDLAEIDRLLRAVLSEREGIGPDDVATWLPTSRAKDAAGAARELLGAYPGRSRVRAVQSLAAAPADGPRPSPLTFSLLPARYTLDGEVLTAVIDDAVRFDGQPVHRPTPDPLDVLFALGNDDVAPLLAAELRTRPYHQALAGQRARLDGLAPAAWQADVHARWLDALRSLDDADARRPAAFDGASGRLRVAQAQLVAWTWLRSDHALFAEEGGSEGGCSFPDIYVDPYPETWRRLGALARSSAALFRSVDPTGTAPEVAALERVGVEAARLAAAADALLDTGHVPAATGRHLRDFIVKEHEYEPTVINGWYASLFAGEAWDAGYDHGPRAQARVSRGASVGAPSPSLYVGAGPLELLVVTVDTAHGPTAFVGPVQAFRQYLGDGPPPERWGEPDPWTEPGWLAPLRAESTETEWKLPPRDKFTVDFDRDGEVGPTLPPAPGLLPPPAPSP